MLISKNRFHTVETPIACQNFGGFWDRKWGVCIKHDDIDGGCLAPIKGLELCWGYTDLYDIERRPEWGDKYLTELYGVNIYTNNAVFDLLEWGDIEELDSKEDAVIYGKDLALEIGSDIKKGHASHWDMQYKSADGKIHDKPVPHCIVVGWDADEEKHIPFSFKQWRKKHASLKR